MKPPSQPARGGRQEVQKMCKLKLKLVREGNYKRVLMFFFVRIFKRQHWTQLEQSVWTAVGVWLPECPVEGYRSSFLEEWDKCVNSMLLWSCSYSYVAPTVHEQS